MNNFFVRSLIGASLVSYCACTHTVVGSAGKLSPDGRFTLVIESHGAARKAYTDISKKRVYLSIFKKPEQKAVFQKEYTLEAGNLSWRTAWPDSSTVQVDFFDFRHNVNKIEGPPEAPQLIATHVFVTDEKAEIFRERK